MRPDQFREALSRWASGVTVVATEHDGVRSGMTASAFTSVSLEPSLVLVCVERRTESAEALQRATTFGISIMAEGQQAEALQMARSGHEKFEGLPFFAGEVTGQPLLEGALVHFECRLFRIDDGGDHLLVLGEVLAAHTHDRAPLIYYHRAFHGVR